MPQVLKEKVKKKILKSATELFYQKDYRSAKLSEIAKKAKIPVALIYSYFKSKEALFDAVVEPIYEHFTNALEKEEEAHGSASERFEEVGKTYISELLKNHHQLVILMDKSSGTKHATAKDSMITMLQQHIEIGLKRQSKIKYDKILYHILASNFTESLLEIARHYQGEKWALEMLQTLTLCHFRGVESL